jgi:hypothetical protein
MIPALIDLLGTFYQAGNPGQMAVIARSMLATMPGDLVAMQFLGLALYQLGRADAALRVFHKVAEAFEFERRVQPPTTLELATVTNYREATHPNAGLADAWHRIGQILTGYGFRIAAAQAFRAWRTARRPLPLASSTASD